MYIIYGITSGWLISHGITNDDSIETLCGLIIASATLMQFIFFGGF